MNDYVIVPLRPEDWEQVRSIFLEGVVTGHATFEMDAPSWEHFDAAHLALPRLAARSDKTVCGWATLTPSSSRCVYAGVAETSIYIGQNFRGQGIGGELLEALIVASEAVGVWTLQAGVFPENIASFELHRRHGFREVGRRERIGKLNGAWRDTLLLERRSTLVGID